MIYTDETRVVENFKTAHIPPNPILLNIDTVPYKWYRCAVVGIRIPTAGEYYVSGNGIDVTAEPVDKSMFIVELEEEVVISRTITPNGAPIMVWEPVK